MKTEMKRSIIRFINGEKRLFERLEKYYNSRIGYDQNDPFEQYLNLLMFEGCPDYRQLRNMKQKILRIGVKK